MVSHEISNQSRVFQSRSMVLDLLKWARICPIPSEMNRMRLSHRLLDLKLFRCLQPLLKSTGVCVGHGSVVFGKTSLESGIQSPQLRGSVVGI